MSAFVVEDAHINALVSWMERRRTQPHYYHGGKSVPFAGNGERIAQVLYSENVRSVNYRYQDSPNQDVRDTMLSDPAEVFEYKRAPMDMLSPVIILKACACLEYQSCETPDWKETEARAILQTIEHTAINALPGYDEAPWAISSKDLYPKMPVRSWIVAPTTANREAVR